MEAQFQLRYSKPTKLGKFLHIIPSFGVRYQQNDKSSSLLSLEVLETDSLFGISQTCTRRIFACNVQCFKLLCLLKLSTNEQQW